MKKLLSAVVASLLTAACGFIVLQSAADMPVVTDLSLALVFKKHPITHIYLPSLVIFAVTFLLFYFRYEGIFRGDEKKNIKIYAFLWGTMLLVCLGMALFLRYIFTM